MEKFQKLFYRRYYILFAFLICGLITAIALLSSLLINNTNTSQCEIYDCSWINTTSDSTQESTIIITYNSHVTNDISFETNPNTALNSTITSLSTSLGVLTRNLYGDTCTEHEQCAISKQLFCEYEFDLNEKHCFCETTHFWNNNTQQCGEKILHFYFGIYYFDFCLERKKTENEGK